MIGTIVRYAVRVLGVLLLVLLLAPPVTSSPRVVPHLPNALSVASALLGGILVAASLRVSILWKAAVAVLAVIAVAAADMLWMRLYFPQVPLSFWLFP